ncbi:cellobiose phosphotransferase system celC [Micractinium conductrix]|uniref:Cellobiose phosphotransferase system celC n=1 Tax=Micractinium conductrix TaxID=554055 RepID=A0A2P6VMP0_9CHLO|nr:cellobiose phosphotransferase system celC [Micractinium conductrix]|eukprot:PSC75372.1 cellobiose phosphotransferase system celC [Micractinium conductrix]
MGCRAWIGAPAAASRLGTAAAPPPLQRWGLLPSVACAAAVQAAWGPGTIGRHEARWLVGHAGAFAAGLLLEGCAGRMQAQHAAAAPPPAGRPAAGRALPTILGTAALVLQAAGLQHLSPFLHFTQGYQLGLHRAFEWTAQALLLPFALLGRGGGGGGHVASALLRLLPALAHGFYRALRMGG